LKTAKTTRCLQQDLATVERTIGRRNTPINIDLQSFTTKTEGQMNQILPRNNLKEGVEVVTTQKPPIA
jgi:hypothetical protein